MSQLKIGMSILARQTKSDKCIVIKDCHVVKSDIDGEADIEGIISYIGDRLTDEAIHAMNSNRNSYMITPSSYANFNETACY